jgi:hypothetical protein
MPPDLPSPEAIAQRQLDAYNARDLEAFVACYSADVELFRPPALEPALVGAAALRDYYARERFGHVGLRAELLHRAVVGATVIDHERIHGVRPTPFEVVVAYQIEGDRIRRAWAFAA